MKFSATVSYKGRNGVGKCIGISAIETPAMMGTPKTITIYPTNTVCNTDACWIEVPVTDLEEFVNVLLTEAGLPAYKSGIDLKNDRSIPNESGWTYIQRKMAQFFTRKKRA